MNITVKKFLNSWDFSMDKYDILSAHDTLQNKMPPSENMTGWVNLHICEDELAKIKRLAEKIRKQSDILIVIGAGGSYCGARAVIELLKSQNYNDIAEGTPKIYFVGHNLSGIYMDNILKICNKGNVSINVISKSGTTLEPSAAFRILREYMEKRYGIEEAKERIICTTDPEKGVLRELADKMGYETLVVPSNIGGRYSVLTPVGLLPIAAAGIDIDELLKGSYDGEKEYSQTENNGCYEYAALRKFLAEKDKSVEMLAVFEPCAETFLQWHRQLYSESLGKNSIGVLPTVAVYTRDLHSVGQYVQDGSPIMFETIFKFNEVCEDCEIPFDEEDADKLNYIANQKLSVINNKSIDGVIKAHNEGNVPVILINVPKLDAYNVGNLIYFLERACAINGILDNVNPFDQPGVEAYKKNIQKILRNNQ